MWLNIVWPLLNSSIQTGSPKAKKPVSFNEPKTITVPSIFTGFFFPFAKVITLSKQESAASILEFSTNSSVKKIYCVLVVFSVKNKRNIPETEVIFLVGHLQGDVLISIGSTQFLPTDVHCVQGFRKQSC